MNGGTFLSTLQIAVMDDCGPRPTVRLLYPLRYESVVLGGAVEVPAGFKCDGASIPRVAMSITGWPGIRAAVVHDYLIDAGVKRSLADDVFAEALAVCGVDSHVAALMAEAVRTYGRMVKPQDYPPIGGENAVGA